MCGAKGILPKIRGHKSMIRSTTTDWVCARTKVEKRLGDACHVADVTGPIESIE